MNYELRGVSYRSVGSLQSVVCSRGLILSAIHRASSKMHGVLATGSWLLVTVLLLGVHTTVAAERDGRWAIVLAGASGDSDLRQTYLNEIRELHSLLVGPLGFPRDQVVVLFDSPESDPDIIQYKSTRKGLEEACLGLAGRVEKDDLVFVFIDGHGSYDGKTYKLNLVGSPDPTAWELASMLYSIPAHRFVVINATSCSGGSMQALSQKGNIVITATKSGMERNQTQMGRYFVEAFKNNAADADKNGRVSIMEAFSYTSKKVEAHYESRNNLQTEHSILDDNGDAQGQNVLTPESGEGLLARTTFLDSGAEAESPKDLSPEQQKLVLEARDLERQIEALKYDKEGMAQDDYEKKLEDLLLRLARINAKLHQ